jgi:glycosyltransferase involved in cell wall biosynthesis
MKVLFAESHNLDRPDPLGSHHYINLFAQKGDHCLWLGPAISPFHLFKPDSLNRHRFNVWRTGIRKIKGIDWVVPFSLVFYYNKPLLRSLFIGRNQYRFCIPPLDKKLMQANFSQVDLLWCAGPVAYSLLDVIPHKISCYRLADRLDQFSRIPPSGVRLQKELIRRVDFVIATSRALYEWAAEIRTGDIYYLPNGVSEIFFKNEESQPPDFPNDGLPVAVYLGTLDTRFDIETVAYAVKKNKQMHFLLIGPVTDQRLNPEIVKLQQENNFSWLGPKRQGDTPAYLQHSAVGIIPFYKNELTEAVNPIKYYEYLACGLPVVAPMIRELVEMDGPLNLYSGADSFCPALDRALVERTTDAQQYRRFAENHTWERRFEKIRTIINQLNKNKQSGTNCDSGTWLSVVVIGRNEAEHLPALFRSLPDDVDIEWIYVDSGSTDASASVACQLGANVFLINSDSVYGPGTGRYVGTIEAYGRWVLYIDGDMILRDEFKEFINKLRSSESELPPKTAGFVGRTLNHSVAEDGQADDFRDYVVLSRHEMGSAESWGKPVSFHGGAVLYLRDEVIKAGNWNPALYQLEEVDLCSRVAAGGARVRAIDLPMVEHFPPVMSLKEKLLLNFMAEWRGKKLYGAGQVVASRLREGGLVAFIRCYPYPFLIFAGLITAPFFYLIWMPLPLVINLLVAVWIGIKKRWYFYLVYLGNLLQILRGIHRYQPFKPGYKRYFQST